MNQSLAFPTIAFLGIGLMGKPMAIRLLKAGYRLHAWNRTRAKAEALAVHGAQITDTPADAVKNADIVITMLETGPVVADVIDRALSGLRPDTLVIDMSSTRQSEAQRLHAQLARYKVSFVDAPVSGGVVGVEAGTLAIMVGGSVNDFARVEPVLKVMGRPTLVGSAGCGQLAKRNRSPRHDDEGFMMNRAVNYAGTSEGALPWPQCA